MSIKFICSCGKHLRARDEMAARRSRCPRCGNPVGVPSLLPTHAGTEAAPLTPQERRRLNRNKPSMNEPEASATASPSLTLPARSDGEPCPQMPKVRRRRQLEQHWHQCLAYPALNWRVLLILSLIFSAWMSGLLFAIPKMPRVSEMSLRDAFPWTAGAAVLMLLAACSYTTVECALISALAGEGPALYWPISRLADPLRSGARCLFCFVAGPIVPAGIAVYFCFYGGDLTVLDWAIVAELSVFAVGYWFLAIVSVNERNRLRDASAIRVAQLIQRLHYRVIVPALVAPAWAFAHALVVFFALDRLHQNFAAVLLLAACWGSALFWSAFLFRLLGVWCYYTKPTEPIESIRA